MQIAGMFRLNKMLPAIPRTVLDPAAICVHPLTAKENEPMVTGPLRVVNLRVLDGSGAKI